MPPRLEHWHTRNTRHRHVAATCLQKSATCAQGSGLGNVIILVMNDKPSMVSAVDDWTYKVDVSVCYVLTQWSRRLPEKLPDPQLVKKFPAFYGTRWFITAFTKARYLSLSSTRSIQSISTSRTSILILSSYLCLGLPSGLLPSCFSIKTLYAPLFSHIRATCPAELSILSAPE